MEIENKIVSAVVLGIKTLYGHSSRNGATPKDEKRICRAPDISRFPFFKNIS